MTHKPLIAVVTGWVGSIPLQVARGALQYARQHTACQVQMWSSGDVHAVRAGRPQAIIAIACREPVICELMPATRLLVGVFAECGSAAPVQVLHDDVRIGQLGAEHLISRRLRSFVYVGVDADWSVRRERGFRDYVESRGYHCTVHTSHVGPAFDIPMAMTDDSAQILAILAASPHPMGVMACSDAAAAVLASLCEQCQLAIPSQVALVSVDNDPMRCEQGSAPLSSIDPDWETVGREAVSAIAPAEEALCSGQSVPHRRIVVPPKGVVVRHSTESHLANDPQIRAAVEFLHANASRPITAGDLDHAMGLSIRSLELRFKSVLGRSPWEELRRYRMGHAAELLRTTDLKLSVIARRCGFEHLSYFSRSFSQHHGISPSEYRKNSRDEHA